MGRFKNLMLIVPLILFCGCFASDEDYKAPQKIVKESGYLVLYRPLYVVGNSNNLQRWLDDFEKEGWRLVYFNNNDGNYIFHKEK